MTKSRNRGAVALAGVSTLAIGLALSSQAFAAAATTTTAAAEPAAVGEIVVTASRVQREGFVAPTPMTVQTVEAVERQALTNVNDFLVQMPSVHGNSGPGQYGIASGTTTNPGVSFVNLRGLGSGNVTGSSQPARTLVLVDGQRQAFQGAGGAVDLNNIPTIMLDRTEIVTGGASAQYGSDAVAGVVNLIYKKNYNGLQAEISRGVSTYHDDENTHMALVAGTHVLGGKGHILFGASYDRSRGVPPGPFNKRPWVAAQYGTVVGAGNVRFLAPNVQASTLTYGGIVTGVRTTGATAFTSVAAATSTSPFHGLAYDPAGAAFKFDYGNIYGSANPSTQSGGSNYGNSNADSAEIIGGTTRYAAVMKGEYNFTDHLYANLMLNYAYNDSHRRGVSHRDSAGTVLTILSDNPFIPASTKALMTAGNINALQIGRVDRDFGAVRIWGGNQTYQVGTTLGGDFDALGSNWSWDAHGNYGSTYFFSQIPNNRWQARFLQEVDAIKDPVSGQVVCRDVAARAAGCVAYNPFGEAPNSAAAINYATTFSHLWQLTQRTDFNANLHGSPFSTWAGKVSVAAGGEYRNDRIRLNSDANSRASLNDFANVQPLAGRVRVAEAYAEAVVPLLSGQAFAKELDFDGAFRRAHYDYSGNNTTWKAGLIWQVNEDVRFRISESQDVRAPNVSELFQARAQTFTLVNYLNPQGQLLINQQVLTFTSGNTNLEPEKARTFTYGVGVSPHFLPGLRASVDYWRIAINKAISTTSALTLVTNCQAGQVAYCGGVQFDPATGIPTVFQRPLNIGGLRTSGIDMDVSYTVPLQEISAALPGRLTVAWLGTYTRHYITITNGVAADTAGQVGGGVVVSGQVDTPHWLWNANANYAIGPATFNLNVRHIGGGVLDVTAEPGKINAGLIQPSNDVPSKTYYNVGLQLTLPSAWTGDRNLVVFGNINNLTNVAPNRWGRDPGTDLVGRYYTLGLRLKM